MDIPLLLTAGQDHLENAASGLLCYLTSGQRVFIPQNHEGSAPTSSETVGQVLVDCPDKVDGFPYIAEVPELASAVDLLAHSDGLNNLPIPARPYDLQGFKVCLVAVLNLTDLLMPYS